MKLFVIFLALLSFKECECACNFYVGYQVEVIETLGFAAAASTCNIDTSTFSCNGGAGPYHGTFTIADGPNGICYTTQKSQTFGKVDQCYTYYAHTDTNSTIGCLREGEGCTPYTTCDVRWNNWAASHVLKPLNEAEKENLKNLNN
eukprot:UN01305